MNSCSPPDRERRARASVILLLALALAGCGASRTRGPDQAVREYIAAIQADDPKKAYALLSEATRRKMTETEFTSRWRELKAELLAQARQLATRLEQPVDPKATLHYGRGVSAELSHADGWQIEADVAVAPPASTPLEAIAALARAMEQRSYDALLKLLARPLRKSIEDEAAIRLEKLKGWLKKGAEVEVRGDRARVRYDARYRLELVNEDGQWRVVDYN